MPTSTALRDQQIVDAYGEGRTMEDLAAQYNVSRQRIHQIIRRDSGPEAEAARGIRRQLRDEQQRRAVTAFLAEHGEAVAALAAFGLARVDVEDRFRLLLPDVPSAVVRDALSVSGAIFNVNVQEYIFPASVIEAAVWYTLARVLNLEVDTTAALRRLDLVEAHELAAALESEGLDVRTRSRIICLVANAQVRAEETPEATITKPASTDGLRPVLGEAL